MFSITTAPKGKAYYFSLRIGKGIAKRSGFRPGDRVKVMFDDETGEGEIFPDKHGRILITGDAKIADCPPVIYKQTWAEGIPSIGARTPLADVQIVAGQHIKFKFPRGTSFSILAKAKQEPGSEVEMYNKHKDMVEASGAAKSKEGRRATKEMPPPILPIHRRRWND